MRGSFLESIFRKSDDRYMGNGGVHTIEWADKCCEFGYWIFGEFEGQGYISELVRLIEEELFSIGFHRLEIRCSDKNERSANVPKRNGYTLDGILRENKIEMGEYRSTMIFGKIKES